MPQNTRSKVDKAKGKPMDNETGPDASRAPKRKLYAKGAKEDDENRLWSPLASPKQKARKSGKSITIDSPIKIRVDEITGKRIFERSKKKGGKTNKLTNLIDQGESSQSAAEACNGKQDQRKDVDQQGFDCDGVLVTVNASEDEFEEASDEEDTADPNASMSDNDSQVINNIRDSRSDGARRNLNTLLDNDDPEIVFQHFDTPRR